MKLSLIILSTLALAAQAFGVKPPVASTKAVSSPLFRDPVKIRGGAVPGWAAYNDALEKKPLITKAMTSLVGWALGDLLTQVRNVQIRGWLCSLTRLLYLNSSLSVAAVRSTPSA